MLIVNDQKLFYEPYKAKHISINLTYIDNYIG